MKRICISTYCEWSSYGSILQSIGLKQALKEIGCDSFIVRDRPAPLSRKKFPFVISKNPKILWKNILAIRLKKPRERLYENSLKFINRNVDIEYYNDYETLKKSPPQADAYLAGSDQIWHPSLCSPIFFLDFVDRSYFRFSYAASMGVTEVSQDKKEKLKEYIQKFETVSVREKEMVDVLQEYTEKSICMHIDPTFLLTKEQWRTYRREYSLRKQYVLVFAIYWDTALNKQLKELHQKTGYDIVAICPDGVSKVWANRKIYDADPGQFLWLVDHAEVVVSSSFHGVALALNFNKRLCAVVNPNAPSRIETLLDMLSVPRLKIADIMDFDLSLYVSINSRIENERKRSISYLKGIVEGL